MIKSPLKGSPIRANLFEANQRVAIGLKITLSIYIHLSMSLKTGKITHHVRIHIYKTPFKLAMSNLS